MANTERTGWRDETISRRHRTWGIGLPAIDIDFLLIEYDYSAPCALIEYKHEHATPQRINSSYKALIILGNNSNIPVFCVRYPTDCSWFRIIPLNRIAKEYTGNERLTLTEKEYILFLKNIRKDFAPTT